MRLTLSKEELVQEFEDVINRAPYDGICQVFSSQDGKTVETTHYTGCHADMARMKGKVAVASKVMYRPHHTSKDYKKLASEFMEWVSGPTSIYKGIMDYLGSDYHVLRNKDGHVSALLTTNTKVNGKLLTNFYKSTRMVSEHSLLLEFWNKWRKYDPGLAYALSFYIKLDGTRWVSGHAPFESSLTTGLAFNRIANLKHGEWDLKKFPIGNGISLQGENKEAWGGKKPIYDSIPDIGAINVPTHFYYKYHGANVKRFTDENLEYFFKNYKSLVC